MFLEYMYILVVVVEVQLCFCAPSIYGDFIAVAAGQSDIFYNSFEVMEFKLWITTTQSTLQF